MHWLFGCSVVRTPDASKVAKYLYIHLIFLDMTPHIDSRGGRSYMYCEAISPAYLLS